MAIDREIDVKIQNGYAKILEDQCVQGCEDWLSAWEDIQRLCKEEQLTVFELDKRYSFTQTMFNFVQDCEMELGNAAIDDKSYHKKRITYCTELLEHHPSDTLIIENTRRAIAETYCAMGDFAEADRLFETWLAADPGWGWGYIGWSDCYWFGPENKQYEKAAAILERALAQETLDDRDMVLERSVELYEELGDKDHSQRLAKELKRYRMEHSQTVRKGAKIGRNDPCPCGSGKKYKKCCGA